MAFKIVYTPCRTTEQGARDESVRLSYGHFGFYNLIIPHEFQQSFMDLAKKRGVSASSYGYSTTLSDEDGHDLLNILREIHKLIKERTFLSSRGPFYENLAELAEKNTENLELIRDKINDMLK